MTLCKECRWCPVFWRRFPHSDWWDCQSGVAAKFETNKVTGKTTVRRRYCSAKNDGHCPDYEANNKLEGA